MVSKFQDDVVDGLYHDTTIGLDVVYLDGGYSIEKYHGEEGVSFYKTDGLMRAVAKAIIEHSQPMTGQDARFMRSTLSMRPGDFASVVGYAVYHLTEWEMDRLGYIPTAADAKIRGVISTYLGLKADIAAADHSVFRDRIVATFDIETGEWAAECQYGVQTAPGIAA